jgi:hypothetical protein
MEDDIFVAELPHMLYRSGTPLHLAAAGLRYDTARALLAAGAPVSTVNRRGATALHYACDPRPSSPTWDPAGQRRIIELLASHRAQVDRPDRGGVTALHRAVRARSPGRRRPAVRRRRPVHGDQEGGLDRAAPRGRTDRRERNRRSRRTPDRDRTDAPRRWSDQGRR